MVRSRSYVDLMWKKRIANRNKSQLFSDVILEMSALDLNFVMVGRDPCHHVVESSRNVKKL